MSAIPSHLAHRPVWHGMPVPYINVWGDERDEHKTVPMLDPVIGQLCWFNAPLQLPETGEPDLGQQSLQRQRRVVIEGLCQVCGRPLPLGPRWLIAGRGTYERIEWNGRPVGVMTEPWLCVPCLRFTRVTCPGIRRALREDIPAVAMRVHRWSVLLSHASHDDHPGTVAVLWAKVLLASAEPVPLLDV
jgi:hypothetical protein